MDDQSLMPIQDLSNSVPGPIDLGSVSQLPPVTDTVQKSPTLCIEFMDTSRSFETFTKNSKDE